MRRFILLAFLLVGCADEGIDRPDASTYDAKGREAWQCTCAQYCAGEDVGPGFKVEYCLDMPRIAEDVEKQAEGECKPITICDSQADCACVCMSHGECASK